MQKHVAERLQVAESSWNDASNEWYSSDKEAAFKLATTVKATSSKSLASLFNDRANTQQHRNKAIFMSLLPNGDERLAVCPTIPVFPGDFPRHLLWDRPILRELQPFTRHPRTRIETLVRLLAGHWNP
jgi:hypothetical protein